MSEDPEFQDTILRGIVGSKAYGLDHEGSDTDRLGCYVDPTLKFLGLNPPNKKTSTRVQHEPSDFTEHEVGKLIDLMLGGNPTVNELLWLPDELYEVVSPEGLTLIGIRDKLLSAKPTRDSYLGYAQQQFKRLSERENHTFSSQTIHRTQKHARHLKRLCWQGYQLYTTGILPIKVENPEEYHEFGRAVEKDHQVGLDLIKEYEQKFDEATTVLPDKPDYAIVEKWLVETRTRHLEPTGYEHKTPEERALLYVKRMVDYNLTTYRSIKEVKTAMDNMTAMYQKQEDIQNAL